MSSYQVKIAVKMGYSNIKINKDLFKYCNQIIIGGGATGVELAAEINETTCQLSQFWLNKLKNKFLI